MACGRYGSGLNTNYALDELLEFFSGFAAMSETR